MGGEHTPVTVDFTADVTHLVRARVWHPSQQLSNLPDGGVRLTFAVAHTAEVLPWVSSWGPRGRLVTPAHLVDAMREQLAATARRYEGADEPRPGLKAARGGPAGADEDAAVGGEG